MGYSRFNEYYSASHDFVFTDESNCWVHSNISLLYSPQGQNWLREFNSKVIKCWINTHPASISFCSAPLTLNGVWAERLNSFTLRVSFQCSHVLTSHQYGSSPFHLQKIFDLRVYLWVFVCVAHTNQLFNTVCLRESLLSCTGWIKMSFGPMLSHFYV